MKEELLTVKRIILFIAFLIDNVEMQSVSWYLKTEKPICEDTIRLACTIDGFPTCCGLSRTWRKLSGGVTSDLVINGASTDVSKYREELYVAANQTTLVIENFNQDSDVTNIEYICGYAGVTDSKNLVLSDDKDCGGCGGKDYGFSLIGTSISAIVSFFIAWKAIKRIDTIHAVLIGGISFLIGSVLDIPVAVTSGIVTCHCLCQPGLMYIFIPVGLLTSAIPAGIIIYAWTRDRG